MGAIDAIEAERNVYVEQLRAFERKRIKAKARGKRTMTSVEQRIAAEIRQQQPGTLNSVSRSNK